ncbi:hypothetical protein CIW54_07695 [Paraburkholderia sp. T12-10]|nr:hypothetical protein CIW54_07695 [Paraburkholderia sp. T12-10]
MGHYACDMRPEWFAKDDPESPKDQARRIVDKWMGERDVVLKTRAYNDLIKQIAQTIKSARKEKA